MFKLRCKFVLVGILSCVIVTLLAVFAVPIATVSADNHFPGTDKTPSNRNTTSVHGTIAAVANNSITITPTNGGNPVTLTLDAHSDINLSGETSLAAGALYHKCLVYQKSGSCIKSHKSNLLFA